MSNEKAKLAYNVPEVAKMLGLSRAGAYILAHDPDFPTITVGKRIIVPKRAFEDWLLTASKAKATYGEL